MPRFPADAPRDKVLKAFAALGFTLVREGNHRTASLPVITSVTGGKPGG